MEPKAESKIAGASNATQVPTQAGDNELGGSEAVRLKQELQHGDFSGLRKMLAQTRQEGDWQDRYFMPDLLVPEIPSDALGVACAA